MTDGAAPLGLSGCPPVLVYLKHIFGRDKSMDYSLGLYAGAGLIVSKPLRDGSIPNHSGGGLRGVIGGFSRQARVRLIKRLASVKKDVLQHGLWLDLTYAENMQEAAKAARDIAAFKKRLRRKYPSLRGIWKKELQDRGAIHFHLLVWGVEFIPHEWLASTWYEIVGSNNPAHLKAGTSVSRVHSARQASAYAAKYQAKEQLDGDDIGGRWWGMIGDWEQDIGDLVEWIVNSVGISRVWRVLDGWRLAGSRWCKSDQHRGKKIALSRRVHSRRQPLLLSAFHLGDCDTFSPLVGRVVSGW